MAWNEWTIERLTNWQPAEQAEATALLSVEGLGFDAPPPDLLLIARDSAGRAIGTGTLAGNVLKQLMVQDPYRGTGLFAELVSVLVDEAAARGRFQLFVFTKPGTVPLLSGLGFRPVTATPLVALLEYGQPGFDRYLADLRHHHRPASRVAGLVMNCNPFTLGHQHLVETAGAATSLVHLFVVSEDRSLFPTAVRQRLVQAGVAHLPNVIVHAGGPYIISSATFPSYFLRQPGLASQGQAELDATIFAERIAPALGITDRFLGEEPLDATTAAYNQALERILPAAGIAVRVIPRRSLPDGPISASAVREALRADDWARVAQLVPQTTLEFLRSAAATAVLERIRGATTPH